MSRDERVLPLLERFHHGYHLVLQLLEESQKGMMTKPEVPTITRTVASGSESGDVSEEGSDVFDTVTQLDDETGKDYMLFCEFGKPTNANVFLGVRKIFAKYSTKIYIQSTLYLFLLKKRL